MSTLTRRIFLGTLPLVRAASAVDRKLSKEEDRFLEDLSHRCFNFFWEQADPTTGLVRDRALADAGAPDPRKMASSAAAYLEGRWRNCWDTAQEAEEILRERCTGVARLTSVPNDVGRDP